MNFKPSVKPKIIVEWAVFVICILLEMSFIIKLRNKQAIIRLNYIEEEVIHKMNILKNRVFQDIEFLKLQILLNSKQEKLYQKDYIKGEQFVTYLRSLCYLRSIAIGNNYEIQELLRFSNTGFLKKEISNDRLTLQFTPISIDENAIIIF